MRSVIRVLVLAVLIGHGLSGEAYAQRGGGIWEWIDKLSGPGPFTGGGFWFNFCIDKEENTRLCTNKSKHWANLKISWATNKENPDRPIEFPDVKLFTIEPSIDTRAYQFVENRIYVEVGAGVGFHRFTSDALGTRWERSVTPMRVGLVGWPTEWLTLEARLSSRYLFAEFTAADFGVQGDFAVNGEWNQSFYMGLTVMPWRP